MRAGCHWSPHAKGKENEIKKARDLPGTHRKSGQSQDSLLGSLPLKPEPTAAMLRYFFYSS